MQLYTSAGTAIGAPLQIDTPGMDGIAELGFSEDGTNLLAHTVGSWARWKIEPQLRSSDQLDALLARISMDAEHPQRLRIPSISERNALRASDPGPWAAQAPRPLPAVAGYGSADQSPIPIRAPGTPTTLLDLTDAYTVGPTSMRNSYDNIRPFLRPYPAGVQRFGGTDFDLRGMLEFDRKGTGCIPAPAGVHAAAIHALLVPVVRTRETVPRRLAEMILHYRDGSRATIPIRTTLEVPGYGGNDQAVRRVFSPRLPRSVGFSLDPLAAPRLTNPEPERALRCVELRTTGNPMLVLGLTLESAPADGAAVISARNLP